MRVVYVKEQGAYIRRVGGRIVVSKNNKNLKEIPVTQMEKLVLVGNIQITTQALHMLMEYGVNLNFFSYGGRYIGQAVSESSKNIFLRLAQYERYQNPEARCEIARRIIDAKIQNQISMIQTHRWKENQDWKEAIQKLQENRQKLSNKTNSSGIMGIEGICSSIYFSYFSQMLTCEIEFHGRNRRPPKDPVNALLSLVYTFLTTEVENALENESFELYLGFLHGIKYGRKSLALDLVEVFRQPVGDRFVLKLLNKQMLSKFDFKWEEQKGILLSEEGFQKFCKEFERWMTEGSEKENFRTIILNQIGELKYAIQNHQEYEPYLWKGGKYGLSNQL